MISGLKTKVVNFGYIAPVITSNGTALEVVPIFVYLGSSISVDSIVSLDEVECRIGKASGVFAWLKKCVWKLHNVSLTMKIFNAVVITTLLYTSKCWMLLATDLAKLEVIQMSYLRRILGVTCHDQLLNETIHQRCMEQPTVGKQVQRDMFDEWTTPVCRSSSYGQNIRVAGIIHLTRQRNKGRIRSLPT